MKKSVSLKSTDCLPLGLEYPESGCQNGLRVISVTSGKGGVGKSNIVVNLGLALSRMGHRVLLIDADLGLANLDILLGLAPRFTIYDLFNMKKSLADVMLDGPEGLKILPASSGIPELADLDKFQKVYLLNELDNYSDELNVVLIDTGAGISKNVLFFNIAAQERIVIVNNELTSITDAYALMKIMVTKYNERQFKILVNGLSRPQDGELVYRSIWKVTERFLGKEVSLDYLGVIPFDEAIPRAVLKQQAVLSLYPKARITKSFLVLAKKLWDSPPPRELGSNIRFFWRRLLECQV